MSPPTIGPASLEGRRAWRMGDPDDVARVARFLASDPARCVTGQTVTVDGGNVLGQVRGNVSVIVPKIEEVKVG